MKTWVIRLNGKDYSHFTSTLRSKKHEQTIIEQWKNSTLKLGYSIPEGNISAFII